MTLLLTKKSPILFILPFQFPPFLIPRIYYDKNLRRKAKLNTGNRNFRVIISTWGSSDVYTHQSNDGPFTRNRGFAIRKISTAIFNYPILPPVPSFIIRREEETKRKQRKEKRKNERTEGEGRVQLSKLMKAVALERWIKISKRRRHFLPIPEESPNICRRG